MPRLIIKCRESNDFAQRRAPLNAATNVTTRRWRGDIQGCLSMITFKTIICINSLSSTHSFNLFIYLSIVFTKCIHLFNVFYSFPSSIPIIYAAIYYSQAHSPSKNFLTRGCRLPRTLNTSKSNANDSRCCSQTRRVPSKSHENVYPKSNTGLSELPWIYVS